MLGGRRNAERYGNFCFGRAFYSAPRGEGDAEFKIRGPATQKNYGNATAAPPEPGRNFGPAFGGAQYSKQNKNKL